MIFVLKMFALAVLAIVLVFGFSLAGAALGHFTVVRKPSGPRIKRRAF